MTARKIRPSNRTRKERVAHEEIPLGAARDGQAHPPGAVTRRVMRANLEIADGEHVVGRVEVIDRQGRRVHVEPEHHALRGCVLVQEEVVAVQVDWRTERADRAADAGHMIDVRVGEQDAGQRDLLARRERQKTVDLVTGIDDHALTCPGAGDDESVLEEGSHGLRLDYDHRVILAILDDLMFSSKIKTTAKALGATVSFARSRDGALADMRASPPALVILDLNNPRTDPLGIVAAMKADPALTSVPTVGFVSHVQTELIDAARAAGVGDVMARSLFTMRLSEILSSAM